MARLIEMDHIPSSRWEGCQELEKGNILFFSKIPFEFPEEELEFLLRQKQSGSGARKNIAYKPQIDKVTNHDTQDPQEREEMKRILASYSRRVTTFLQGLLPPYAPHWKHDYASFRPFQERGRKLRLRARNDLLHVDAFPTRPLHGERILRFFTNINRQEGRRWVTSLPFEELAKRFGGEGGVPFPHSPGSSLMGKMERAFHRWLGAVGWKIRLRSPYDTFMLRMHHFLKENQSFQQETPKDHWEFPPGSCWAVFTDQVSHAALSGQYALEQTFLIPLKALLFPDRSPVRVLERLSGRNMIDVESAARQS
jgi:hypothetical protein